MAQINNPSTDGCHQTEEEEEEERRGGGDMAVGHSVAAMIRINLVVRCGAVVQKHPSHLHFL